MSETISHDSVERTEASRIAAPPKPKLSGVPLLIVAIGVVLFVQALFVFSYIGALHHPKPHRVAFGVVGASQLPAAVGTQFSLKTTRYASEADALDAIDQRKIDGALVADPAGVKLIVVPAAGNPGASALAPPLPPARPRWIRSSSSFKLTRCPRAMPAGRCRSSS